jgi:tetratricopeptide (TPR) repeat protein
MAFNLELFQLYLTVNYLDLARDRLETVVKMCKAKDFSDETRVAFSQDLAKLDDGVKEIQAKKEELAIEQQASPVQLAMFSIQNGMPGLAIHDLEEAERTGTNPNQVLPLLLDLYCDTGQPEKAVEMLSTGTVGDAKFGEPGLSEMRQGRAYFLWGNYEYTANLWERSAILRLRQERAMRAIEAGQAFIKGGVQSGATALLELPEKIANQAAWEFDAGLCRLEGGEPKLAAEHFTKALQLVPNLGVRPVIAYYLEKMGVPVPPLAGEDKAAVKKESTPAVAPK